MTHEIYGLLGKKLSHSFSRRLFSEKFARENLDAEYQLWESDDIGKFIADAGKSEGLRGFNVTIPYKTDIIPFLDSLSIEAREIGAVNTVKVIEEDGIRRLKGFNTDAEGFRRSLAGFLPEKHFGMKALVLGTGGASKAVAYALRKEGIYPSFVSRRPSPEALAYGELDREIMDSYLIIVNTTPLGTFPDTDTAPDIPYGLITSGHFCHDLVYNPSDTLFMIRCRESGAKVRNGLEMLRNQALASWEIWRRND